MNISSKVSIEINDTKVILEGVRKNLFINTIIVIENPNARTLVVDEKLLGENFCPSSKRNFRATILNIVNFFIRKNEITREVESDLRKLVNQNIYKEKISDLLEEFKNNFITDYDELEHITINKKNVTLSVPNSHNLKLKLIFLFTGKYHYGLHLIINQNDLNFSLTRWRKLLNTNSIIKQLMDWESLAKENNNSELFFISKVDLKSYLIYNKSKINSLLLDINDYTKK